MPPAGKSKHQCVSECRKSYATASRLSGHQKICSYIQQNRKRLFEIRSMSHEQSNDTNASSGNGGGNSQGIEWPPLLEVTNGPVDTGPSIEPHPELGDAMHIDLPPEPQPSPSPVNENPPANPLTASSGRPRRNYRLPRRFEDILPAPPTALDENQMQTPVNATETVRRVTLVVWEYVRTTINRFGLWQEYPQRSSFDPDTTLSLDELSNTHCALPQQVPPTSELQYQPAPEPDKPSYWPFPNKSIQLFMSWLNNGNTTKSESEADKLIRRCILSPDFNPQDMVGFSAHRENRRMDREVANSDLRGQFTESSVSIQVPTASPSSDPPMFSVSGLLHRDLTEVIRNAFTDPLAHLLHYSPFKLFHQISSDPSHSQRVYGEVYTSDTFIEEYKHVQRHGELPPDDPNCKREKAVAALMFSSDATQLTDFGNAKAWPIYMMLGNLSKYIRSDMSSGAMHHLAYIPSLPEGSFKAFASRLYSGSWHSQEPVIMAHCRRELMHAVWCRLLDDKFLHAYRYGIVVTCIDGVERRIYPRFFSYSADYPEKVLLATIRDKGLFPCPRCLVHRSELHNMGLRRDKKTRMEKLRVFLFDQVSTARNEMYRLGHTVRSQAVEALLSGVSAVPTFNAFVDRLGKDFNPSTMLTVDLLHEVELGTWKALFAHSVRVLYASSDRLVTELNERFRQVPLFGNSGAGIRRFPPNVSEMKKMAARDFEDLLQCALPCFDGLLPPPQNRSLMKLLYRFAEWHALAKLRMHTDKTLDLLAELTTELGHLLRQFRKNTASDAGLSRQGGQASSTTSRDRIRKPLNLSTIKFHFMGDYPEHIRRFGTTDSYSTQLDFISKLKDHLLGRLTNRRFDGDMHDEFSNADRNSIRIRNNRIFRHHTVRVNYTTYDIRRDYDTIKPRNRPFCMVASPDTATDPNAHPFWYAAVMGVFHAEVQHTGIGSRDFTWKTVEFLWVRWLGIEPDYSYGRRVAKLPKFGFVPDTDDYAFSFLDPAEVIRGCHLIPAFFEGRTSELMPYSGLTEARSEGEEDDWMNYYVNIFVDRDMYLRYIGFGIGHQAGTAVEPGNDSLLIHDPADGQNMDDMAMSDDDEETFESGDNHEAESDEEPSDSEPEDRVEMEEEDHNDSEEFPDSSDDLEYDDF
ncbi:hypothetical protein NP233_g3834 [Leucocoprinus birnbaumii]|uniref:C2H2-type domain-containing protein n=1 Tax=Leucocoprinus birnbaumii TaxID=56174 RepID=A0AAD5YY29_9AGAR|nr:hypothetical protein NP233_g3834 [Leucocoprinus birnbaumii]